jgi:hypothetical protein
MGAYDEPLIVFEACVHRMCTEALLKMGYCSDSLRSVL